MRGDPLSDVNELAARVAKGDMDAALEIFHRFEPLVERLAAKYGFGPAYDRDDVRQDAFLALLEAAAESVERGLDFAGFYRTAIIRYASEGVSRYGLATPVPAMTLYRVRSALERFDGNVPLAREWAAHHAPANYRVTTETFDAVCDQLFGSTERWNSPASGDSSDGNLSLAETTEDPTAHAAIQRVDDREEVESILSTLSDTDREIIERSYGLGPYDSPQESAIIAATLGIHEASVRRTRSRVIRRLRASFAKAV